MGDAVPKYHLLYIISISYIPMRSTVKKVNGIFIIEDLFPHIHLVLIIRSSHQDISSLVMAVSLGLYAHYPLMTTSYEAYGQQESTAYLSRVEGIHPDYNSTNGNTEQYDELSKGDVHRIIYRTRGLTCLMLSLKPNYHKIVFSWIFELNKNYSFYKLKPSNELCRDLYTASNNSSFVFFIERHVRSSR